MKNQTNCQGAFHKQVFTFLIAVFLYANAFSQALTPVTSFGSNPGKLNMYSYVPTGVSGPVSLVVVLHGCTQSATSYAAATGWNKLADKHKFILVYPEQIKANNSSLCFNWFDSLYQQKNQFQVLSIIQMVDYMKSHYAIDTTQIFITGLSAGAAMSNVMLANYPKLFNKGAIMSGVPFKAAKDTLSAYYATKGKYSKPAKEWGALVKNANPKYKGKFPDVAIFHGDKDSTVYYMNAAEEIKQWTNVNAGDQIPDLVDSAFQGNPTVSLSIYNDTVKNKPVVYFYRIKEMKHAVSIDTGACPRQGGEVQTYAKDFNNFHSTYWAADFFGILTTPYLIKGITTVFQKATNIVYSAPKTNGSTYKWTVPAGATIVSGQGTNSIVVNFGTASGDVSVQETVIGGCIKDKASKFVKVLNYNVAVQQTKFIKCYGDKSGELTAKVFGSKGPYTLNWTPINKTTAVISNLSVGTYTLTVKDNSSKVIYTASYTVVQPALKSSTQTLKICEGESVKVGTNEHTESGTYTDVLKAANGCDSIVKTILTVSPVKTVVQIVTICMGDSYTVGTSKYTSAGQYTDTLTSVNGCDSTVHTTLVVAICPIGLEPTTIVIYPNPITDFATIQFDTQQNNITIKIVDGNGNVVFSTIFSGTAFQINAADLNPGNYTVLIIDGAKILSETIMVR